MNRDRFLNPDGKKSKGYVRSAKQEKELAKRGSGKEVYRSGAGMYQKGDVKGYNGIYTIEAKTTQCKSFSITREMIMKIEDAAVARDELPAIIVEFLDEDGIPIHEVAVVPTWALDRGDSDDGDDIVL